MAGFSHFSTNYFFFFFVKRDFQIQLYAVNLCYFQISAWAVLEDMFNSFPKLWRSEGKKYKESMVRCAILCILSTGGFQTQIPNSAIYIGIAA